MEEITRFMNPRLLWLLLVIAAMAGYYVYRTLQGGATLTLSDTSGLRARRTARYYLRHAPFVLRCLAVALAIVALARPQKAESGSSSTTEGIDIVLALDISGSMLARDFNPDRITAARDVATRFVIDRPDDRIGLVVFAGESFTQCPLTTDKSTLVSLLGQIDVLTQQVRNGTISDGTAIGNGLATAINRLKESAVKSKVVILLTDGVNNSGQMAPLMASEIAQSLGIRVYTIGVGSMGTAPYPVIDMWGKISYQPMKVEIDEDILRQIAAQTGGEYFRATDNTSLQGVYDQINQLERSKIETDSYIRYKELFAPLLVAAFVVLMLEFLVRFLWLRQIP